MASQFDGWAERKRLAIQKQFKKKGSIPPAWVMLVMRHPKTLEPLATPMELPMVIDEMSREKKDALSEMAKGMCKKLNAVAIVFFTEAWMHVPASHKEAEDVDRQLKQGISVEHIANRKEVVFFVYEREGVDSRSWCAEIIRPPGKPPELTPWRDFGSTGAAIGRFANFLYKEAN